MENIKQQPQHQDALVDQLIDLRKVPNKLGMYDAAELFRHIIIKVDAYTYYKIKLKD